MGFHTLLSEWKNIENSCQGSKKQKQGRGYAMLGVSPPVCLVQGQLRGYFGEETQRGLTPTYGRWGVWENCSHKDWMKPLDAGVNRIYYGDLLWDYGDLPIVKTWENQKVRYSMVWAEKLIPPVVYDGGL
jgi:hypothetical protein